MVAPGSRPYRIHPEADRELRHELSHYHAIDERLADRLFDLSQSAIHRVCVMPGIYALGLHGTRAATLKGFPVRMIYREVAGLIQVVAFAHTSRRPGYWRERLDDEI